MPARAYEESLPASYPSLALKETHRAFHRALVSACDSPRLLRLRDQLFDETERYRRIEVNVAPNRDPAEEHRLITEATLARNVKRAQKLLAEHIGRTAEAIVKAMTEENAKPSRREQKRTGRAQIVNR